MCRTPCGAWATRVKSNGELAVDKVRWLNIKRVFAEEIRNKLEGKSSQIVIDAMEAYKKNLVSNSTNQKSASNLAQPGELRKEYLELIREEEENIRLQRQNEEKESLELIKRLLVSFNNF